jgi:acyl-CoA thioester hydrolase
LTTISTNLLSVGHQYDFEIPMRWADADSQNHLNNAMYFRYFEEARMQMLYVDGQKFSEDYSSVVVSTSCDFIKPVMYPARISVRNKIIRLGRSSLEAEADLYVLADIAAGPYAKGKWVLVYTSNHTNKAVPWSEDMLRFMATAIAPYRVTAE